MADEPDDAPDFEPPVPDEIWEQTPEQVRRLFMAGRMSAFYSGPLPPPSMLEKYEAVVPGLGRKIVDWTEDESQNRREMERSALEEQKTIFCRGQWTGAIVALFGLSVAGAIVSFNPTVATASVAIVLAIVAVGGPFAARRLADRWNKRDRDREEAQ